MKHAAVLLAALGMAATGAVFCASHCGTGGSPAASEDGAILEIYVAASLKRSFEHAGRRFSETHPGVELRIESGGSLVLCRKITELGLTPDLVVVADSRDIDRLLRPEFAAFALRFAANEMVLAHRGDGRRPELSAANWFEILQHPDVTFGIAAPDQAPAGYNALLCWRLADQHYGRPVHDALTARLQPSHVRPDVAHLMLALESGEIDYAFSYRSEAEQFRVPYLLLPAEINLGSMPHAERYARASVEVSSPGGSGTRTVAGSPIVYGATIHRRARHATLAAEFIAAVLGAPELLEAEGIRPLRPPEADGGEAVPAVLRAAVEGR